MTQTQPNTVGKGTITESTLATTTAFAKYLEKNLKVEERMVKFILNTILPDGHPEKMNISQALLQYFPGTAQVSIINKAFQILTSGKKNSEGFLCQLFHGLKANEIMEEEKKQAAEKAAKPKTTRKNKKDNVTRAEEIARKCLKQTFCSTHNLKTRGRMPKDLKNQLEDYIKSNLEIEATRIKKDMEEIEKGQPVTA